MRAQIFMQMIGLKKEKGDRSSDAFGSRGFEVTSQLLQRVYTALHSS